ncbi:MAG: response regulator [Caldithrix sp.]|nr:MAG: response regulator [Caldithrix sp.]
MAKTPNKILIVDDEEVIRNICQRSLESRGYTVQLAENGIKALEYLRQESFEVVFTDFKMPMMDGIELLEAIKRDHPHVEVVIMTAFATIESAIYAMKEGAFDFILKPVKPDQIRIVANRCFDRIKLGEENKALRLANEKLTELQNMKNKFIAITSHELRTPVSHLKGYVGILADEYAYQLSDQEKKQCMQVISDAILDLEEIVTNMHNLIHMESSETTLKSEKVDIAGLVQQSVSAYQLTARKRKQEVKVGASAEKLVVTVDRAQIKGVLNELIQNAIKFTPDGGKIEVSAQRDGDYCLVCVKDNGIGIPSSEQGLIFEKFYEVQSSDHHSSSKEAFKGGGLGLGLPSVRAIVEAHGGGVKVKSGKGKGKGTEFQIFLPINGQKKSRKGRQLNS